MLRRIRILIDLLRDLLAQPRLLGKPLASEPSDGMPADLNSAQLPVDVGLAGGDHVGLVAETEGVLERELAFQCSLFSFLKTIFSGHRVRLHLRMEAL